MSSDRKARRREDTGRAGMKKLLEQYGCGPIQFTGTGDALYERHLMFDNVVDAAAVGPRERYEAVARSVRDVLSQRWLRTEQTYERENPKRVYYLSMEFLIGRSLANNIMNLLLDPVAKRARRRQGPRLARPARAGARRRLGQWRARPPRGVLPRLDGHDAAPGHGLRAPLRVRHLQADDRGWLATRAAGQLAAPARSVGGRPAAGAGGGQARLLVRGARRQPGRGRRPAVEPARPAVRSAGGGLWRQDHQHAPALGRRRARCLRLPGVQRRRVRERAGRAARGRIPDAGPLSRQLHEHGARTALRAGVFPRRLLARGPRAALPPEQSRLERAPRQGRDPAQRHPPQPGRARADADPARRGAPRMGRRPGTSPDGRSPTPTTRSCPRPWRNGRCGGSRCCCRVIWRSSSRSTAASSRRCGPASRATRAASSA